MWFPRYGLGPIGGPHRRGMASITRRAALLRTPVTSAPARPCWKSPKQVPPRRSSEGGCRGVRTTGWMREEFEPEGQDFVNRGKRSTR